MELHHRYGHALKTFVLLFLLPVHAQLIHTSLLPLCEQLLFVRLAWSRPPGCGALWRATCIFLHILCEIETCSSCINLCFLRHRDKYIAANPRRIFKALSSFAPQNIGSVRAQGRNRHIPLIHTFINIHITPLHMIGEHTLTYVSKPTCASSCHTECCMYVRYFTPAVNAPKSMQFSTRHFLQPAISR
jgi:hypothetical protein